VYVIYTSGSTGKPKGVMVTHCGLVISNAARIAWYRAMPERFLLLSPLAFDSSVVGIFWTLCEGGTLVLVPDEVQRDILRLADVITTARVTHLLTLPSFYALLVDHALPGQLNGLRTVIVAGEPCPKALVDRHRERCHAAALFSEYGATETTVWSNAYDCTKQTLPMAPIGSPIANAEVYLLDARRQPVPVGVPGEVYLGGAGLAKGYLHRPDLTAERFIAHPFGRERGARLYRSGDLARHLPGGDIEFLGRIDNQVKIRGFRVELEEIEALLRKHPAVREAAVVLRGGEDARSRSKHLVGYVVAESATSPDDFRAFLGRELPGYMIPATFVRLDRLPLTPNGKVDRRALSAPGPVTQRASEPGVVAPRTSVEQVLARIWADLLGVPRVGIHDNFFELGGDSILSIQMIARCHLAGLRLTPRDVFRHQTIAELASAGTALMALDEQAPVTGALPLTPIQLWFLGQEPVDPDHANVSMMLELRRPLDHGRLRAVVRHLLEHHDALRLRFRRSGADWQQTVAPSDDTDPVSCIDLADVAHEAQEAAILAHAARLQASLDLAAGPLVRVARFDLGSRPGRLLLVFHHLAFDGVSWRIVLEDLATARRQLEAGAAIQLPAKTSSFKRWAERLPALADSAELAAELDYWLASVPSGILPCPLDYPEAPAANTVASSRTITVTLTPAETAAVLQTLPRVYGTRIDDVLLTALVLSWERWTGRSSLLIELESHGREDIFDDVDVSRTVGWFTAVYPVLLTRDGPTRATALTGMKARLRGVPRRGIGYGLLRYLSSDPDVRRRLAGLPRPDLSFNNLGQFDQVLSGSDLFGRAWLSGGPDRSPRAHRPHVLEVVAAVVAGRMQVDWVYSERLHRAETIEAVAEAFIESLRAIIAGGQALDPGVPGSTGVADFGWDEAELRRVTAAIRRARGDG
jgi:non-ribosomal peptide synthase protein (TIGR01720 family)